MHNLDGFDWYFMISSGVFLGLLAWKTSNYLSAVVRARRLTRGLEARLANEGKSLLVSSERRQFFIAVVCFVISMTATANHFFHLFW
jgi:hypothetical protein